MSMGYLKEKPRVITLRINKYSCENVKNAVKVLRNGGFIFSGYRVNYHLFADVGLGVCQITNYEFYILKSNNLLEYCDKKFAWVLTKENVRIRYMVEE